MLINQFHAAKIGERILDILIIDWSQGMKTAQRQAALMVAAEFNFASLYMTAAGRTLPFNLRAPPEFSIGTGSPNGLSARKLLSDIYMRHGKIKTNIAFITGEDSDIVTEFMTALEKADGRTGMIALQKAMDTKMLEHNIRSILSIAGEKKPNHIPVML